MYMGYNCTLGLGYLKKQKKFRRIGPIICKIGLWNRTCKLTLKARLRYGENQTKLVHFKEKSFWHF